LGKEIFEYSKNNFDKNFYQERSCRYKNKFCRAFLCGGSPYVTVGSFLWQRWLKKMATPGLSYDNIHTGLITGEMKF